MLPDESWGSRKDKSAGDIGLMKTLNFEMSALTRRNIGIIDVNAKACYDRILRPIGALACYKHGLPLHTCCWLLTLLNSIKHHIITHNGILKEYYQHTDEIKLHGFGQGSCEAPVIWLLISSIIFLSMQDWAQGLQWQDTSGKTKIKRYSDAFVDDANLWNNSSQNSNTLVKLMKKELLVKNQD